LGIKECIVGGASGVFEGVTDGPAVGSPAGISEPQEINSGTAAGKTIRIRIHAAACRFVSMRFSV
jgi:hypothetical protein